MYKFSPGTIQTHIREKNNKNKYFFEKNHIHVLGFEEDKMIIDLKGD